MARGSRKKRKNQNRSITLLSSPSMSKTPPTSSRFSCRRTSMSILLLSSFTILLFSTSKTTFLVSSTEIYSFEVINEFPHDPNAFTQVPLFLNFAILCLVAFFFFFRFILILMLKWSFWVCLDVPQFDNGWIVLVKWIIKVWEFKSSGVEIRWYMIGILFGHTVLFHFDLFDDLDFTVDDWLQLNE